MRLVALVLVLGALGSALAEDLPPGTVQGKTLRLDARNCSIDAPGDDWSWSRGNDAADGTESYLCRRGNVVFALTVNPKLEPELGDEFMKGVRIGMEKSLVAKKAVLAEFKHERSDVPIAGKSVRYTMKALMSGKVLYWHGYMAEGPILYSTLSVTESDEESDDYKTFVRSFKLEKPVPSKRRKSFSELGPREQGELVGEFLGLFGVAGVVVWWLTQQGKKAR